MLKMLLLSAENINSEFPQMQAVGVNTPMFTFLEKCAITSDLENTQEKSSLVHRFVHKLAVCIQ